jgi:uncharacterized protein (TIGR00290 family)
MALHKILNSNEYEVVSLITTVTKGYDRISMHGVRTELLHLQAIEIGLPLHKIMIPQKCTNEDYQEIMQKEMGYFKDKGINNVIFGDLYLQDIRAYRESQLSKLGMKAIFPLWGSNTTKLAKEFIESCFKTILSCVDTNAIDKSFSGRIFDDSLLNDLPKSCDPCGENGEFHSFLFDGPLFNKEIPIKTGKKILREDRFYYTDIIL